MIIHKILYNGVQSYNLFGKMGIFLQINALLKKKVLFCLQVKKNNIPLRL